MKWVIDTFGNHVLENAVFKIVVYSEPSLAKIGWAKYYKDLKGRNILVESIDGFVTLEHAKQSAVVDYNMVRSEIFYAGVAREE